MLPINEITIIDGTRYKIQSTTDGYLVNNQFTIYEDGSAWKCSEDVHPKLLEKIGKKIEDLIWFRAMGI